MVITFVTLCKIMFAFSLAMGALGLFGRWLTSYDEEEVVKSLSRLFKGGNWEAAERFLDNGAKRSMLKTMCLPMIKSHDRPWRIMMEYETQQHLWNSRKEILNWGYYVKKLMDIAGMLAAGYLFTTAQPESFGWAVTWIATNLVCNLLFFRFLARFGELHKTVVQVRNRLYEALEYIPAEYRGHETRSQAELERWRKEIDTIEAEVLAGRDPDEATLAAVQRIERNYSHRVTNPGDDPLPNSRLDMLMGD